METIEQRLRKLEMWKKDFEENVRQIRIEIDTLFSEVRKIKGEDVMQKMRKEDEK